MAQNANTLSTSQMPTTPANKEVTVKSTTVARATATSGPAAMAAEIRKNKKKKAGTKTSPPQPPTAKDVTQGSPLQMNPKMKFTQLTIPPPQTSRTRDRATHWPPR